jgi:hypothetical protein
MAHHLGEDWNGTGGGDTDLGDRVYCAADGLLRFAVPERAVRVERVRVVVPHTRRVADRPPDSTDAASVRSLLVRARFP